MGTDVNRRNLKSRGPGIEGDTFLSFFELFAAGPDRAGGEEFGMGLTMKSISVPTAWSTRPNLLAWYGRFKHRPSYRKGITECEILPALAQFKHYSEQRAAEGTGIAAFRPIAPNESPDLTPQNLAKTAR